MAEVRDRVGDDWNWDDYESRLRAAGFVIPTRSHGPYEAPFGELVRIP